MNIMQKSQKYELEVSSSPNTQFCYQLLLTTSCTCIICMFQRKPVFCLYFILLDNIIFIWKPLHMYLFLQSPFYLNYQNMYALRGFFLPLSHLITFSILMYTLHVCIFIFLFFPCDEAQATHTKINARCTLCK